MNAKKQTPPAALDLFGRRRDTSRRILLAALGMTSIHAAAYWHLADKINSKEKILLLDDRTYYLPKALDFVDAKELHVGSAELVMESLFDRSPSGLDHAERLKRLCERTAYQDAMKLIRGDYEAFGKKEIHQKVEIQAVRLLQAEDDSVRVAVEGQLIRSGQFDGGPFSEVLSVKVRMLLVRNPSMVVNGAFPELLRSLQVETSPLETP